MEGTFHRRELKSPSVSFSSPEGRDIFKAALNEGHLEDYFHLAEHYITQGHPAFCGVGSLTMALNSLLLDPKRVWQGVWRWFDESMLDCCEPLDIIRLKGITLPKLSCLARCNGAKSTLKYGDTQLQLMNFEPIFFSYLPLQQPIPLLIPLLPKRLHHRVAVLDRPQMLDCPTELDANNFLKKLRKTNK